MLDECKLNDLLSMPEGYHVTDALFLTYSMSLKSLDQLLIQCGITDTYNKSAETLMELPNHVVCVMKKGGAIYDFEEYESNYANLLNHKNNCRILKVKGNTFHPKLYAFLYENNDNNAYKKLRIIISSRNITSSNYYEGAICIDGEPSNEIVEYNTELVCLLNTVTQNKCEKIIECLKKTDFSECLKKIVGDDQAKYRFITTISSSDLNKKKKIEMPFAKDKRVRVISPFLGDWDFIKECCVSEDYRIITREQVNSTSLPKDKNEKENVLAHMKCIKTLCVKEEEYVIPLHAKIYAFSSKNEDRKMSQLYLGSANYSQNGFQNNYELMIEIISSKVDFVKILDNAVEGKLIPCIESMESTEFTANFEDFEENEMPINNIINNILKNVEEEELGKLGVYLFNCSFEGKYFIEEFVSRCVNMDIDDMQKILDKARYYKNNIPHQDIIESYLDEIIGK